MALYRIAWRELNSGATGNGEYILTKEVAEQWLEDLQKKHLDMKHWIESNEDAKNPPS